jgi:hypothetical protein
MPGDYLPSDVHLVRSSYQHDASAKQKLKAWIGAAPHIPPAQRRFVAILGQVGFAVKSLVYGILGGLICSSAVSNRIVDESPQGVFVLVAGFPVSNVWMSILAVGVGVYAFWRFSEGVLGQGSSPDLTAFTNCFRFRVSPIVSGTVYVIYCVYIIGLMFYGGQTKASPGSQLLNPALSAIVAIAFLLGFIAQMVHTVRGQFLDELKDSVFNNKPLFYAMNLIGRIGFLGRGLLFMLVSVLFWKQLSGTLDSDDDPDRPSITRALATLHGNKAGRAFLFVVGFSLLVYALFAAMCVVFREFPTRTPTGRRHPNQYARSMPYWLQSISRSLSIGPGLDLQRVASSEYATDPTFPFPPFRTTSETLMPDSQVSGPGSRLVAPLSVQIPLI